MKTTLIFILSGLLLCGCSQKHAASARPATDLVEAGKNVTWSDGYVLFVAKRDGLSLEGIRVVQTLPNGQTTISSDKGRLQPVCSTWKNENGVVISTNTLQVDLQDAFFQGVTTQAAFKGFTVYLHQ